MSWAMGLSLWIIAGGAVAWAFGAIASRSRGDEEWDSTADFKRRIDNNARRERWGGRAR
jgi:hypothetical protein